MTTENAVALTLRMASEWIADEGDRTLLIEAAANVANSDMSWVCPMCEEVACDDHCPLAEIRAALV